MKDLNLSEQKKSQYAYSIKEAADHFRVSTVTFQKWKNEGIVHYAQYGRKLIIDLEKTMKNLFAHGNDK
mgnify:CR=1 FL=1